MRWIREKMKQILYADQYVSEHQQDEEWRNQQGIALIAVASFVVMSLLNISECSYIMLATTAISAAMLLVGWLISRHIKKILVLQAAFLVIFVVVFTVYTITGGNNGFAALWLVLTPYVAMMMNLKKGFFVSLYYQIMLLLLFLTPMQSLLQFEYGETFRLRFPFLYLIDFAFAAFLAVRIRIYQYELLQKQEEFKRISLTDLTTGLLNRNGFNGYVISSPEQLKNVTAVYIDVNGLHEINNRSGHEAGDRMLRMVADLCVEHFPASRIFRMGGDEFLVLTENEQPQRIAKTAAKLAEAVEHAGYSIAYGMETQTENFQLAELVKRADLKMLQCKQKYYQSQDRQNRL